VWGSARVGVARHISMGQGGSAGPRTHNSLVGHWGHDDAWVQPHQLIVQPVEVAEAANDNEGAAPKLGEGSLGPGRREQANQGGGVAHRRKGQSEGWEGRGVWLMAAPAPHVPEW
jgi:hypothetical protein